MKNILKILISIIIVISLFLSMKGIILSNKKSIFLSNENTFKEDMLESIMEFANDSTSIDSLYIPNWLK